MPSSRSLLVALSLTLGLLACSAKEAALDEAAAYRDLPYGGETVSAETTDAEAGPAASPVAPLEAQTVSADPAPTAGDMPEAEEAAVATRGGAVGRAAPAKRNDVAANAPMPSLRPGTVADRSREERAKSMPMDDAVLGGLAVTEQDNKGDPQEPDIGGRDSYTDHGVNPMTLVTRDAQSTFSIDVDTASYTQARRSLLANGLPNEAGVRVEEFVNYFDYDSYYTPKDDAFAVNMEAMPDPFRPGHHILRVGVQGKEISREARAPVHLVFLVDVSGSMSSEDKLGLAKKSLHMMVDNLREDDTVALATYAGRVARILEPTSAAHKQQIHRAIESLNSGGSTAMSSGIDLAYTMAMERFKKGHENRVVVLSDGDANVGNTSWDSMLSQIKGYADKGVTLSTIGFGRGNYQDTLMEQLANKGDGNNYYIDDQQQAQRVFVEELGGTMVTIARDVKIQVEFNPESVAAYRLVGYENRDIADKDFRNDRVDAGEVGSGHNVTALYDVVLKDGYTRDLATVRMRWEQPGADSEATEQAWRFQANRLAERPDLASRDSRIAYTAATFAEVLRASPHAAEIDLADLARFAEGSKRPGEADDVELIDLIRRADALGADQRAYATARR